MLHLGNSIIRNYMKCCDTLLILSINTDQCCPGHISVFINPNLLHVLLHLITKCIYGSDLFIGNICLSTGSCFTVVLHFLLPLFHQFVISITTYNLLHPFIHIYAFTYVINSAMNFPVELLLLHYKERNLWCPIQTSMQLLLERTNTIH